MNQQFQNLDQLKTRMSETLGNPRAKAFLLAIVVLVFVVILQVGNHKNNTPMCELLSNCKLRNVDLHRMQIALSQSGLSEFQIDGSRMLVPKSQHAVYLQAVADQNAIPPELRSGGQSPAVSNPFLSRSQQVSIERDAKKKQIQEMVVRLPFVDQAWFEMDAPESRSTFSAVQKAAVVSIRPIEHTILLDQHVDTVRQMIGGAVAGMDAQQIVVIDLSTGFAHRHSANKGPLDRKIDAQQAAFARQQLLESRIRQALSHYDGLRVTVIVDAKESVNQLANSRPAAFGRAPNTTPDLESNITPLTPLSNPVQHASNFQPLLSVSLPVTAGANGQASIYDAQPQQVLNPPATSLGTAQQVANQNKNQASGTYQVELASYEPPADSNTAPLGDSPRYHERISVLVDVPYELLVKIYGEPGKNRSATTRSDVYKGLNFDAEIEQNFALLKNEIQRAVMPLVATIGNQADANPIVFNMIRPTAMPANDFVRKIREFSQQNWPSIAVLVIGLVLISLVTQTSQPISPEDAEVEEQPDVISLESGDSGDDRKRQAEIRLSRLIEKDPDAAAKVIEHWIRDAA